MEMVVAFAEFERAILKERTRAGLEAARGERRIGGRRPRLAPQQQVKVCRMVSKSDKAAAGAVRLFKTIRRLSIGFLPDGCRQRGRPNMPDGVDGAVLTRPLLSGVRRQIIPNSERKTSVRMPGRRVTARRDNAEGDSGWILAPYPAVPA